MAGAAVDRPTAILELGALVLLAAGLAWAARRLGLPSLVGLLAAGVAVSPLTLAARAEPRPVSAVLARLGAPRRRDGPR